MTPTRFLNWAYALLFFLVPFLFTPKNFELFEFNKMIAVYILTVVIAGLWLGRMVLEKRFIFRRTFFDIPLFIFLISQYLSFLFSIDHHISLWGFYSRFNGGLVSIICYILLYWAYVSNVIEPENAKYHLKLLLISAGIVSVYAIMEHFGVSPSCVFIYGTFDTSCWIQQVQERVFATLGQPNWLAAWLTAVIPLTWAQLIYAEHQKLSASWRTKYLPVLLSSILFLTIIYTKSRSGLLGIAVADAAFWGIIAIKNIKDINVIKGYSKSFIICHLSFIILVAASGTPWTPSVFDKLAPKPLPAAQAQQPSTPALEGGGTETSAIRKIVWKGAIDIGLAHPLFGTGVETFAESYYQYRPAQHNNVSEWDFLYNKAHNEFLNYFATTGFFGLGSYLILIGFFLIWSIKQQITSNYNLLLAGLLAGYISILVTNTFGFSVVNVQLLFFLFPAMAAVITSEEKFVKYNLLDKLIERLPQKAALTTILIFCFLLLLQFTRFWFADTHYAKANQYFQMGQAQPSFLEASQALSLNENEPVYDDLMAQSAAALATAANQQQESTLSAELANLAIKHSNKSIQTSPYSLQFWTGRTRVFYSLAEADPAHATDYLGQALEAITRATILAPTHPKMFYNLGLIQIRLGLTAQGEASLLKAVSLKPDYKEPRYALALLFASQKKYPAAIKQGKYILEKIDPTDKTVQDLVSSWSASL
jgi:O-antigen ligase